MGDEALAQITKCNSSPAGQTSHRKPLLCDSATIPSIPFVSLIHHVTNRRKMTRDAESSAFSRVPADVMAIIVRRLLPSPAGVLDLPVATNHREADRCWCDYRKQIRTARKTLLNLRLVSKLFREAVTRDETLWFRLCLGMYPKFTARSAGYICYDELARLRMINFRKEFRGFGRGHEHWTSSQAGRALAVEYDNRDRQGPFTPYDGRGAWRGRGYETRGGGETRGGAGRGGGGADARKQRSAARARVLENSGRRRGRGCAETAVGGEGAGAKTAVGGGGSDARKQRSAARAQVRKISGRRRGRGCAKTAVGGESAGVR